jgi:hypothetical protein
MERPLQVVAVTPVPDDRHAELTVGELPVPDLNPVEERVPGLEDELVDLPRLQRADVAEVEVMGVIVAVPPVLALPGFDGDRAVRGGRLLEVLEPLS